MELRENNEDNRTISLADPFKASLALSIRRRREQHNVASDLDAMPIVRSQRSPRMPRQSIGYSPSIRVPAPRMPSPIRFPIMVNPVEPALPRRPSYTYSPTPSLQDALFADHHSRRSRSPARSPGRSEGIPEPTSWYRPALPPIELDSGLPDFPPYSPHTRLDSAQESVQNIQTTFAVEAQNPVSTTPPVPGAHSEETHHSRQPSPVQYHNKPASSLSQIVFRPTNIPDPETEDNRHVRNKSGTSIEKVSVVQSTEHENKWGPGWGPVRAEPEQLSEQSQVQEKNPYPTLTSRRTSRQSAPQQDEPWLKEDNKGPSTVLHRPSVYSISKRSSRKSFPVPQPSAPEELNTLSADLEAGRKHRHPDVITYLTAFVLDTAPRQAYLHCHLRLPYMYFSRINRIFRAAGLSVEDIKEGMLDKALREQELLDEPGPWASEVLDSNTTYDRLQKTWNALISSLINEWTNLNIVSALLLA